MLMMHVQYILTLINFSFSGIGDLLLSDFKYQLTK